jgi:maleate isomerase
LRIGLIVPSSNTVMEPDFHRHLAPKGIVSTARIFLEDVTREAELRMLQEDLPRAAELIRTTAPDITVFGCTSAGSLGRLSHDAGIRDMLAKATGAKAVTVLEAVFAKLRAVHPRKLAVFTPYVEDLTSSVARSLGEAGFPPVKAAGMGIQANLDIGKVTPAEIVSFVLDQVNGLAPDCIFLSCTNWQAIQAIPALAATTGVPVISSNQAAIDFVSSLTQ